jgi:hypothetical protein
LTNPALYARNQCRKKREEEKNKMKDNNNSKKRKVNKTEAFHSFFQSIVPIIKEIWMDRCKTPVVGGRIVAEYDALLKQVTQLYTMREMVPPEDEMKVFNEPLKVKLEATNQQSKKWILRWRPVIDHSMKRVKERAKDRSLPIWRHFTADKPANTKVSRRVPTRQHDLPKKMSNNPLTNVFKRIKTSRSISKALPTIRMMTKKDSLLTRMFTKLGKSRSTSRVQPISDIEEQCIVDRFGDSPT